MLYQLDEQSLLKLKNYDKDLLDKLDVNKSESICWPLINKFFCLLFWKCKLPINIKTPGITSLFSLGCLIFATRMSYLYSNVYPSLVQVNNIICLLLSTIKYVPQETNALNFLFTNMCQNAYNVLIIMLFIITYRIEDPTNIWVVSHAVLMTSLLDLIDENKKTQLLSSFEIAENDKTIFTKCYYIYDKIYKLHEFITKNSIDNLMFTIPLLLIPIGYIDIMQLILPFFYVYYYYKVFSLFMILSEKRNYNLILFFSLKIISSYFAPVFNLVDICFELFGYGLLITELYLQLLGRAEIRSGFLILFGVTSIVSRIFAPIIFSIFYYFPLYIQIMEFCHLPLLEPVKTCYVNGVFDLGHYNHMNLFKNAKICTGAHRLIVGVMSDNDVKKYKGDSRPIDSIEERLKFVLACSPVTEAIKDAPWDDVPIDLILKYNIDCVAHSTEYSDDQEDYCYKTPKKLGMIVLIPRGEGASTSNRVDNILKCHRA